MRLAPIVFLATCSSVAGFAPAASSRVSSSKTQLQAEQQNSSSRREAMGTIGAALGLGAGLLFPQVSNAANNPALQTFKGGKKTKGSFIPGVSGALSSVLLIRSEVVFSRRLGFAVGVDGASQSLK